MDVYPVKAVITAKEKRYQPAKHYVFIVEVCWSDSSKIPIYRTYSDFAQLHTDLSDVVTSLPESDRKNHQLPVFPAKKVFQRNEIRKNATVRRHAFDDYCMALLSLDKEVSQHKLVTEFFKCRDEDINPPKSETAEKPVKKRPSSILEVLSGLLSSNKKSPDGNDQEDDPIYVSSPIVCETYLVLADYNPEEKSEIKLTEGMSVEVVEKYDNGWWFVQIEDKFGWAPATYLTPKENQETEEPEPLYKGNHKYITVDSYTAEQDDEVSFNVGVLVKVLHKLLDGWWIVDYKGTVGYAPATYLVPFNNPHYRGTVKFGKSKKKPTRRRTTIKNSKGKKLQERKQRDMSLYKKFSRKISQEEAKAMSERILARIKEDNADDILQRHGVVVEDNEKAKDKPKEEDKDGKTDSEDPDYEYIEPEEMEEIQEWANEIRPRSYSEVPQGYKQKNANLSEVTIKITPTGSCEDIRIGPKRSNSHNCLSVPGFAPRSRRLSNESSSVTALGTTYNSNNPLLSPRLPKLIIPTASNLISDQLPDPSTPDCKSDVKEEQNNRSVYSTPSSELVDPPVYYNKAPPSPNMLRKQQLLHSDSIESNTSSRPSTPPGMAFVFPPRRISDTGSNISCSRSVSPVVIDDAVVNNCQQLSSGGNSRSSSPPEIYISDDNGKSAFTSHSRRYHSVDEVPTFMKHLKKSPRISRKQLIRSQNVTSMNGMESNNNGATVNDVMLTLIGALQSKTVSNIRTNEQGELIISFEKIDSLQIEEGPTLV